MAEASTVPSTVTCCRLSAPRLLASMPVGSVEAFDRAASQPKRVQSCEDLARRVVSRVESERRTTRSWASPGEHALTCSMVAQPITRHDRLPIGIRTMISSRKDRGANWYTRPVLATILTTLHPQSMENRWKDEDAEQYGPDPLALRVYTSRLLGREPALVLHGGGNTSVKTTVRDLFGVEHETLFVKGSGWDL